MPWWGNQTLATQFATALGGPTYQGLPDNENGIYGPYFAYIDVGFAVGMFAYNSAVSEVRPASVNPSVSLNYVITATPVPLESDALPVVGSALFMAGGLWWKKKRAQAKVAEFVAKK